MSKEAMKLALEALEYIDLVNNGRDFLQPHECYILDKAITALREALAEQPAQQEPVGCEGAIVNGRVYADRLEHDYKFECEAGPLHLCADWVELRRCFEWLAQHTSPPAQRTWVGLTHDEVMESWDEIRDGDWAPDFYAVIEAKLKEKNT